MFLESSINLLSTSNPYECRKGLRPTRLVLLFDRLREELDETLALLALIVLLPACKLREFF